MPHVGHNNAMKFVGKERVKKQKYIEKGLSENNLTTNGKRKLTLLTVIPSEKILVIRNL